jgi:hypothetical protein
MCGFSALLLASTNLMRASSGGLRSTLLLLGCGLLSMSEVIRDLAMQMWWVARQRIVRMRPE